MQDDFSCKTEAFLQWLQQREVTISSKISLADLRAENRGRGALGKSLMSAAHTSYILAGWISCPSLDDIGEDEILFSIPRTAVLNLQNTTAALGSTLNALSNTALPEMAPWLVCRVAKFENFQADVPQSLSAIMMCEAQRPESTWSPYFAVLPAALDSLIFWTDEELAELQASAVLRKIGKAIAEQQYRKVIDRMAIPGASIELFHKTASCIMAYAFDIPEEPVDVEDSLIEDEEEKTILTMIPLADMLNADADRNNAHLVCDSKDLEMRAIKPIKKGEEIFNDYGQLPRSDLLRRYGYITDNYAQYDIVEIPTDLVLEVAGKTLRLGTSNVLPLSKTELQARVEVCQREDFYEESYDISHADSDSPCIPDDLLALIWILCLNSDNFAALQGSTMGIPSSRNKLTTSFVGVFIKTLLECREKQYGTTLEEDNILLESKQDLPHRHRMAVQVRLGEKELLRQATHEAATFQAENVKMRSQATTKRPRDGQSILNIQKRVKKQ